MNSKKKKKMEVILSESYKVNTVIMCKYFSKMIRNENNIMFKFLHKYKSTEKVDIIKRGELKYTLIRFFKEINKAKCNFDQKLKIISNENKQEIIKNEKIIQLETHLNLRHIDIKKDFIERIIKIFIYKINYINTFFEKHLEVKDSYVINSDLNENAFREILNSEIKLCDLKSTNMLGDKKRLKNIILEKYESFRDEYYFDKTNDFSKKDNFIKTLKEYKKSIESIKSRYKSDQYLSDFSDRPNDPSLLSNEKSTKSVNSSSFRDSIKSLESKEKLGILISNKLHISNINNKTKNKIIKQINKVKDCSKINLSIEILNLPENHEFNQRLLLESNFYLIILKLNSISCKDNEIKEKLNNILNKKFQLEIDINDKDNILDAIFIWLSNSNIVEELTNFNVYNFINNIRKTISTEKFLIFLFIERNLDENKDKYNDSLNKLFKLIESIDLNIKNSVIFVYVDEDNIEYDKKKTLMLNLADHLKLERFFEISDSVSNILEYSDGLEDFKVHENSIVRALNYMSRVLSHEIYSEEQTNISEDDLIDIESFIGHLYYFKKINKDNFNLLKKCITKFKNENKKLHLSPIVNTLKDLDLNGDDLNTKNKLLELICSSKEKYIGYVFLISNDFFKNQASAKIKNRLNKNSATRITHKHMGNAPKNYDVILYNVTAIKSIYPINVDSIVNDKNKKISTLKKNELLEHLFYYELINTISSYCIYLFSYEKEQNRKSNNLNLFNYKT